MMIPGGHKGLSALLFCFFSMLFAGLPGCSSPPAAHYPVPPRSGNEVRINVTDLQEGQPLFFSYPTNGKRVNFFLLRLGGRVSSFLDACVTCYRKKQGYGVEQARVVCRACDKRFSVHQLEQGLGGCYPIKLEGALQGKEYAIPVPALERAASRF